MKQYIDNVGKSMPYTLKLAQEKEVIQDLGKEREVVVGSNKS